MKGFGKNDSHNFLHGRKTKEWNRIWLPAYFCPEVIESIISTGIGITFYSDDPLDGIDWCNFESQTGDILLANNFFGYRSKSSYDFLPRNIIQIIEEHSHHPWSDWNQESEAD